MDILSFPVLYPSYNISYLCFVGHFQVPATFRYLLIRRASKIGPAFTDWELRGVSFKMHTLPLKSKLNETQKWLIIRTFPIFFQEFLKNFRLFELITLLWLQLKITKKFQ